MAEIKIDMSKAKPLFADRAAIRIKASVGKDSKGGETKTMLSELIFLDQTTPIARIVLTQATTTDLARIMANHIKPMEEESKRKGLPK